MRQGSVERERDSGRVQLEMIIVEHYEAAAGSNEEATWTFEPAPVDTRATIIVGQGSATRSCTVFLW